MSINSIQNGIIRTITTDTGLSCNTVFADDYRGLGAGSTSYIAVSFGGMSYDDFTFQKQLNSHTYNIDIYTIRTGELANSIDNAHLNLQSVLDALAVYPFLNQTTGVYDHQVVSISPVNLMDPNFGTRQGYLHQNVGLSVQEICDITRSENSF